MNFESGPVTKQGRMSVLEAFLETPEVIAAMARGADVSEEQIRAMIKNVIAKIQAESN